MARYVPICLTVLVAATLVLGGAISEPLGAQDKESPLNRVLLDSEEEDYLKLAREAEARGDLAQAEIFYRRAVRSNPIHRESRLGYARVLSRRGEFEDALEQYRRISEIYLGEDGEWGVGRVLFLSGRYREALQVYGSILDPVKVLLYEEHESKAERPKIGAEPTNRVAPIREELLKKIKLLREELDRIELLVPGMALEGEARESSPEPRKF